MARYDILDLLSTRSQLPQFALFRACTAVDFPYVFSKPPGHTLTIDSTWLGNGRTDAAKMRLGLLLSCATNLKYQEQQYYRELLSALL